MKMPKKKIPDFATLDEAAAFWETHSFVDYADATEQVEIEVNLPPKQEAVQIELTAPVARSSDASKTQAHNTIAPG